MRSVFIAIAMTFSAAFACGAETVSIQHRFGTTTIDGTPERVVSLSYIGHDYVLALGVVPVGLRYWYGPHPYGVWPWAQDALGDAEPAVIYGDIDVEQIALLEPDLILGQASGMTEREYNMLSTIAPTVAPLAEYGDYGTPWQVMHERIGIALCRAETAREQISALEERITKLRQDHPEWQGSTGTVGWPVRIGAFAQQDIRGRLIADLGFAITPAVNDMVRGTNFYVIVPPETLEPIDTDILIWMDSPNPQAALDRIQLRPPMRAAREGREILIDEELSSAMSHSSPLSLNFALDYLVPVIVAAADGNPRTHARNAHAKTVGAPDE